MKNYNLSCYCVYLNKLQSALTIITVSFLVTGCMSISPVKPDENIVKPNSEKQTTPMTFSDPTSRIPAPIGVNKPHDGMINRCENELQALKSVNHADYRYQMEVFSKLMLAASQYAKVRSQTDPTTSAAIDALYQYRTYKICSEISWRLLSALSDKGVERQ